MSTMKKLVAALLMTAFGTGAAWAVSAGDFPIITDTDDGPLVINGCEIKAGAKCPGVDLRHADLKDANLAGADLSHALLDRAARDHVLKTWRFEPAQVDGRLVSAWGRVPILFALH